ncbi:MAG TPA: permease-like cell division protein FtsX [Verrucomicrobiae bacterium]|nr:permease-like cell division protein FtsX [Verrucomicrobiae bacterium]
MNRSHDARATLRQNKQLRRRWLTFVRMCRYGVNNFSRNAWLTVAATAVMTITLLIVFSTFVARNVLISTVDDLRNKVDVSIYLKNTITPGDVAILTNKLKASPNVNGVRYVSAEEAKQIYAEQNSTDPEQLQVIAELPNNPFPASLRVSVKDLNNMKAIEEIVTNDTDFKNFLEPTRKPSFAGERKEAIENIGQGIEFAQRAGVIASVIFMIISILIIFNTIRMAIFNRKEEIQMMKLIGADRNFIRGPFLVEAMMYGFFAAVIATFIGWLALRALQGPLSNYGIIIQPTLEFVTIMSPVILAGMIVVGAIIGIISSLFAVHRYLKV